MLAARVPIIRHVRGLLARDSQESVTCIRLDGCFSVYVPFDLFLKLFLSAEI